MRHLIRRAAWASAAVAIGVVATLAVSPGDHRSVQAVGDPLGAGGEFHSLTPSRILDTRDHDLDVKPFGRKPTDSLSAGQPFDVPIAGLGGLPKFVDDDKDGFDDNVLAVVVAVVAIVTTIWLIRTGHAGAAERWPS